MLGPFISVDTYSGSQIKKTNDMCVIQLEAWELLEKEWYKNEMKSLNKISEEVLTCNIAYKSYKVMILES